MRIANLISQFVLGVVFIFSGFVKAVDPLGSVYKFNDYFTAFGISWLEPLSFAFAILMCAAEFIIGFAILFGLKLRYISWGGLLFMAFFTPLTLYIAITNPVSDCGCFGDALIMTNNETFIKNIFLLAAAIVIFLYRNKFKSLLSDKLQWSLITASAVFIGIIMIYSLRHLPIIDFRPWKVGNNVLEKMIPVQDEIAEYVFVYKNISTGELKEFDISNLPSSEDGWEYADRKDKVIQEYIGPAISDFIIQDAYGDNLTEYFLENPDYHFLLFAYDLNRTLLSSFKRINTLAEDAEAAGLSFIGLTASPFNVIDNFRHEVQAMYPFYLVDEIALKTAIRANPGIILMKNGVVIAKWHHSDTPDFENVRKKHMNK